MALVLAIDPALAHHDVLQRLADDLAAHEIVFASSRDEALAIISRQIPDLVVFPIFCSEADEARIAARVAALSDADDPRTLAIPLLASTVAETPGTPARWFYWFRLRGETTGTEGGDSVAFAEEIGDYLATEPDDLSAGVFRGFSAAEDSLGQRVTAAVPAAARAIPARLSEFRPEHSLAWRQRISSPTWLRSVGRRWSWQWEHCQPLPERSWRGAQDVERSTPSLAPANLVTDVVRSVGEALPLAVAAVAAAVRAYSGEALRAQTGTPPRPCASEFRHRGGGGRSRRRCCCCWR